MASANRRLAESVRPRSEVREHVEDDEALYRPRKVALALGIDGRTLRLWSKEFAELLGPSATRSPTADGAPGQRRYAEADLEVLRRVRKLLDQGLRYDEVRRRRHHTTSVGRPN